MTQTVGNVSDEIEVFTFFSAEQTVNGLDDHLDDVDVLPLVETADIVRLSYLAIVEDCVDGTCMVNDIEPVAHVLTGRGLRLRMLLMKRGMSFSGN